jgi:hypothetical protein
MLESMWAGDMTSLRFHVFRDSVDFMPEDSTAYSIDGHLFQFSSSIDATWPVAGYVTLERAGAGPLLGQIQDIEVHDTGAGTKKIAGRGELRAVTDGTRVIDETPAPFGSARLSLADPALVLSYFAKLRGKKAGLDIGKMRAVPGDQPAILQAAGFGRHTLVCGQSGSGKTYSLGVILERLLLETDLRIAVLDPNSDYVRLAELSDADRLRMNPTAHAELSRRYNAATKGFQFTERAPVKNRSARGSGGFHLFSRRSYWIWIRSGTPTNTTYSDGSSATLEVLNTRSVISVRGRWRGSTMVRATWPFVSRTWMWRSWAFGPR